MAGGGRPEAGAPRRRSGQAGGWRSGGVPAAREDAREHGAQLGEPYGLDQKVFMPAPKQVAAASAALVVSAMMMDGYA
jgi:hypothetical protein